MADNITSTEIKAALARRHEIRHDFFLAECKTGPTQFGSGLLIFDGLAIAKSWMHPLITGYEIKVSRGDFKRDAKYRGYMPYCHQFYFVCPSGLIDRAEVEPDIGLIWFNPNTSNLVTKRKAEHRKIEISTDLLMYVIMNRLESDRYPFHNTRAEFWHEWLENKKDDYELGRRVNRAVSKELEVLRRDAQHVAWLREREKAHGEALGKIAAVLKPYHSGYIDDHNIAGILEKVLASSRPACLDEAESALQKALDSLRSLSTMEES